MRRFGGLRRIMPITAATFLIGALALAGVAPFAGFFSKDEILASLHSRGWPDAHGDHGDGHAAGGHAFRPGPRKEGRGESAFSFTSTGVAAALAEIDAGHPSPAVRTVSVDSPRTWRLLFWMALATAGLTAFYTFRAVFMTFTGPTRVPEEAGHHAHESPPVMTVPLVILAIASAVSGWLLFSTHALAGFLAATPSFTAPAVAATAVKPVFHWDLALQGTLAAAVGIALAAWGHLGRCSDGPQMERFLGPFATLFARKFFLDEIYSVLVVRPLETLALLAALFDRRVIDGLVDAVAKLPFAAAAVVRQFQSGLLQRYALAGVVGVLAIVVALAWQLRG